MPIFTHIVIGANDLEKARSFYDRVLEPLAVKRLLDLETASFWGSATPELMVTKPINGKPATAGNGSTVSFMAPSRAAVADFHNRALEAGGQSEGAPGPRPMAPTAYGAYIRDPDGNKLAAISFTAE
jgi:catechol 2,3-dioxygenase-like lactoylglutathione lyase family enzyme